MSNDDMTVVEQLREYIKGSCFNRNRYEVTSELANMYEQLNFYGADYMKLSRTELTVSRNCDNWETLVSEMTPKFQRDNDKWDLKRKIKFVENILCGYPSTIMLYTLKDTTDECKIIDGLQRLTALDDWFKDKFPVFGNFYHKDFIDSPRRAPYTSARLSIQIHKFESEKEAVKFYIDINEGISHSTEDIERAKAYLATLEE